MSVTERQTHWQANGQPGTQRHRQTNRDTHIDSRTHWQADIARQAGRQRRVDTDGRQSMYLKYPQV